MAWTTWKIYILTDLTQKKQSHPFSPDITEALSAPRARHFSHEIPWSVINLLITSSIFYTVQLGDSTVGTSSSSVLISLLLLTWLITIGQNLSLWSLWLIRRQWKFWISNAFSQRFCFSLYLHCNQSSALGVTTLKLPGNVRVWEHGYHKFGGMISHCNRQILLNDKRCKHELSWHHFMLHVCIRWFLTTCYRLKAGPSTALSCPCVLLHPHVHCRKHHWRQQRSVIHMACNMNSCCLLAFFGGLELTIVREACLFTLSYQHRSMIEREWIHYHAVVPNINVTQHPKPAKLTQYLIRLHDENLPRAHIKVKYLNIYSLTVKIFGGNLIIF